MIKVQIKINLSQIEVELTYPINLTFKTILILIKLSFINTYFNRVQNFNLINLFPQYFLNKPKIKCSKVQNLTYIKF